MPFEPKGERARWRVIYDLLVAAKVGDVITYKTLAGELDLDPETDRHSIQVAMRRAAVEHEAVDKRAIDPVPNVGYRIVEPPEHLDLARMQQGKARRALVRGHSKATNVDLSAVPEEIRHAFDVMASAFAIQLDYTRRLDVRQQQLDVALRSVQRKTDQTEGDVAELRGRLDELERRLADDAEQET